MTIDFVSAEVGMFKLLVEITSTVAQAVLTSRLIKKLGHRKSIVGGVLLLFKWRHSPGWVWKRRSGS